VQLQQVFMNLMLNGIDAMHEPGDENALTIRSHADQRELVISVSDTGVGLPPQEPDQMFNAFFTTKDHGTGMGLPISRSIIESHGGPLCASNNPAAAPPSNSAFLPPARPAPETYSLRSIVRACAVASGVAWFSGQVRAAVWPAGCLRRLRRSW
jgi:signal transduction histidine kinase